MASQVNGAKSETDQNTGFYFRKGTWNVGVEFMPTWGTHNLGGSTSAHDLITTGIRGGRIMTERLGGERWYAGNLECYGLLFSGYEISPDNGYLMGLNPGLRYYVDTDTRWVPYIDVNAGISLSDIGEPDLGGKFQFNEQIGLGLLCRIRERLTLNVGYRFLHVSNAGIQEPNNGINGHMVVFGFNWQL